MSVRQLAQVAVDTYFTDTLTYLQNPNFHVERGSVVNVPLGTRTVKGVVVATSEAAAPEAKEAFELKEITSKTKKK